MGESETFGLCVSTLSKAKRGRVVWVRELVLSDVLSKVSSYPRLILMCSLSEFCSNCNEDGNCTACFALWTWNGNRDIRLKRARLETSRLQFTRGWLLETALKLMRFLSLDLSSTNNDKQHKAAIYEVFLHTADKFNDFEEESIDLITTQPCTMYFIDTQAARVCVRVSTWRKRGEGSRFLSGGGSRSDPPQKSTSLNLERTVAVNFLSQNTLLWVLERLRKTLHCFWEKRGP